MAVRVLIFQSSPEDAKPIVDYFQKHDAEVYITSRSADACDWLKENRPHYTFIDLHFGDDEWLTVLNCAREKGVLNGAIITNKHPDLRRELLARERGANVFLRTPFTSVWIERSLRKLRETTPARRPRSTSSKIVLPRVKFPMRVKITLPYAVLALLFALAGSYLVSRYVLESLRSRFTSQLIDTGVMSSDWMVREENRLLETLRLVNNTEGVSDALAGANSERLREIILPVAVNYGEDVLELIDLQGESVLSLYKQPGGELSDYSASRGDTRTGQIATVRKVLEGLSDSRGDKFAGFDRLGGEDAFFITGPVFDDAGNLVGAIVIGRYLSTLVNQIRQETLAHVTIYDLQGTPIRSTLFSIDDVYPLMPESVANILTNQDANSTIREISVASANYAEILGAWEARSGEDLGVIGVSLGQNFFVSPTVVTQMQALGFVVLFVIGVVVLGFYVAHQITQPLASVVDASVKIAQGNLEIRVPSEGNDEVMVLGHAFNYMVSGLQEGFIYRDLLGRTVSPEVREALRYSFASGDLRLEGQNTVGTVLMSDIRGFTSLSETEQPTVVLNWLNEYFGEIVPVITSYGGVVDKFEGDAMLAFFGILPKPVSPEESAYKACQAALALMQTVKKINLRREQRGDPAFITGIGINTGSLTAGGLGTADRLNYTIIGDTVNTTQRLEGVTREFGESGIVISEHTLEALGELRAEFRVKPLGARVFKGKRESVWVYRLYPTSEIEIYEFKLEAAVAAD